MSRTRRPERKGRPVKQQGLARGSRKRRRVLIPLSITLAAVLLLSFPYLLREKTGDGKYIYPAEQPYFTMRVTDEMPANAAWFEDAMVHGKRTVITSPFHWLLRFLRGFLEWGEVMWLLLALGAFNGVMLFEVLKRVGAGEFVSAATALFFVLSPAFIGTHLMLYPSSLSFALTVTGFYFLAKDRWWLSIPFFLGSALFSLELALLAALGVVAAGVHFRKSRKAIALAGLILLARGIFESYFLPDILVVNSQPAGISFLNDTVAMLGAKLGFPAFLILLAFLGLFSTWKKKRSHLGIYLLSASALIAFAVKGHGFSIYTAVVWSYFGALGFRALLSKKWALETVKNLTLLLVVYGLLFTPLAYEKSLLKFPPSKGEISALEWIAKNNPEGKTVVSSQKNGFFIEFVARSRAMIDPGSESASGSRTAARDLETLLHTRNMKKAREILDRYDAGMIYIDKKMLEGEVWAEPDEGLLFLFSNREDFSEVFRNSKAFVVSYHPLTD